MWLHDFLPKDLEGKVRIMVYGYDTRLRGDSDSKESMLDIVQMLVRDIDQARKKVNPGPWTSCF